MNPLLWQPGESAVRNSNLMRFLETLPRRFDPVNDDGYRELHRWSVDRPDEFWPAVWRYCGIRGVPGDVTLKAGAHFMDAKWFPHGTLNFAENLLVEHDSPAIIFRNERGERSEMSRAELKARVHGFANWLTNRGIQAGDRVAAVLPNVPEAVIAMLGTALIGAVWSSCSPDFGDDAIVDRFRQIEPSVLITTTTSIYFGKIVNVKEKVAGLIPKLPSVQHQLTVNEDFQNTYQDNTTLDFPPFPFDHPLAILYSSGTTGAPKCIMHGAGGTLLQHVKEHQLHGDIRPGDRVFYYTTTGWMMWNWLVSVLASKATIILYDGSPLAPSSDALWKLAGEERVTHFGASAKYYAAIEKAGVKPKDFDLSSLRMVMSTGSPLLPESFDFLYREVKPDFCLASISGGTDIISCFALGCPTRPVRKGELQAKGLGMDVKVFNDAGAVIVNEPGELVCTSSFPSRPVGFWNDTDNKKYEASYFERFENFWCHGDWATETPNGGMIIHGRSDTTLNPGGVRIGTAELYNQIETFPEVAESLVVGLRKNGDEQIVLFLKMKPGEAMTPELVTAIKQRLKTRCSPRHVPRHVFEAADFPRTISGKTSEVAVRNSIHGEPVRNLAALANPESLTYFQELRKSV